LICYFLSTLVFAKMWRLFCIMWIYNALRLLFIILLIFMGGCIDTTPTHKLIICMSTWIRKGHVVAVFLL